MCGSETVWKLAMTLMFRIGLVEYHQTRKINITAYSSKVPITCELMASFEVSHKRTFKTYVDQKILV